MPKKMTKEQRREELQKRIENDPFLTDEELASIFSVSVPTIRLDRKYLQIPEVRKRVHRVAQNVRSLGAEELIGELVELKLDQEGVSKLEVTEEMVFSRNKIMRGHHIFAQANSLAIAIIDAKTALTGLSRVRYRRPVHLGEELIARAEVIKSNGKSYNVKVVTKVADEIVFYGKFVVVAIN